jgi:PilZ domain
MLADLSERGAAVLVPRDSALGSRVSFEVEWPGQRLRAGGVVRRRTEVEAGLLLGIEWPEATGSRAIHLARMTAQLTARHYMLTFDRPWDRFGALELRRGHRRGSQRRAIAIPAHIASGEHGCWAVTEDISAYGALLLSPKPFGVGATIDMRPWDGDIVSATVVRCDELLRPPGRAWRLGLRVSGPIAVAAPAAMPADARVISLVVPEQAA